MMLKHLVAIALLAVSSLALSQTIIYYEDGSVYTLKEYEKIFVSTTGKMYRKQSYRNGNVFFTNVGPNENVDPEALVTDGMEPGSEEWCEVYVPYQLGYTFDDQIYERACRG